jgi:hypothetical protein
MNIKTTCNCGVKENVASLEAIKKASFDCTDCGEKVKVEVTGLSIPDAKKVTK